MHLRCEHCGAEIDYEIALPIELEPGEVVWYCDVACHEEAVLVEEDEALRADPAASPV